VSVVAIVFLPIGIDFFVAAQCRDILLGHHIVRTRHPAAHVQLAGDDIGNLPVAVFADQFDFFFGTQDGFFEWLSLVIDPPADGLLFFDWWQCNDSVFHVMLAECEARDAGCQHVKLLSDTGRPDGAKQELTLDATGVWA